jgi:hypothetical protein
VQQLVDAHNVLFAVDPSGALLPVYDDQARDRIVLRPEFTAYIRKRFGPSAAALRSG